MKLFLILLFGVWVEAREPVISEALLKCVRIAEPLIHDPEFVFPLTVPEIRRVCRKWDLFVDCIRRYTNRYLTKLQQIEFDKAINPAMQSIHQLCIQDERYEKAYLFYAPCMKMVAIEQKYCGEQYKFLAKAAESEQENGPDICCGYHEFRGCILHEASRQCSEVNTEPPIGQPFRSDSSHFVSSMLERALGFLNHKCSHYEPSKKDCAYYFKKPLEQKTNKSDNILPVSQINRDETRSGRRFDDFRPRNNDIQTKTENTVAPIIVSPSTSKYEPVVTSYPPKKIATKRFTWTTPTPSYFPTKNYSHEHINNRITEPESQLFKSSSPDVKKQMTYLSIITMSLLTVLAGKLLYSI